MKKLRILLLFILFPLHDYAQKYLVGDIGGTAGISFAFGSTINRIGIVVNGYVIRDFLQLNSSARFYWNISSFGPRGKSKEMQLSVGLVGAWGYPMKDQEMLSPVSNQTGYHKSCGYAYTVYIDDRETSQSTGTIGVQIYNFHLIHENDILSGTGGDKFRTGGLLMAYQEENFRYAINYIGWTGNPKGHGMARVTDSDYPAKKGYKDLRNAPHGKFSNGIVALQAERVFEYGQVARVNIGIDAEQVRNLMQNRFMHEFITGGVHYPMLDANGNPYLFQEGQKVRPVKFFYEAMANQALFY